MRNSRESSFVVRRLPCLAVGRRRRKSLLLLTWNSNKELYNPNPLVQQQQQQQQPDDRRKPNRRHTAAAVNEHPVSPSSSSSTGSSSLTTVVSTMPLYYDCEEVVDDHQQQQHEAVSTEKSKRRDMLSSLRRISQCNKKKRPTTTTSTLRSRPTTTSSSTSPLRPTLVESLDKLPSIGMETTNRLWRVLLLLLLLVAVLVYLHVSWWTVVKGILAMGVSYPSFGFLLRWYAYFHQESRNMVRRKLTKRAWEISFREYDKLKRGDLLRLATVGYMFFTEGESKVQPFFRQLTTQINQSTLEHVGERISFYHPTTHKRR